MNTTLKLPFYAKFAFIAVGFFALICTMYVGKHIIVPLLYATVFAILLNPFVNFLVNKKINRKLAISIAVLFFILVTGCFLYFISIQISLFAQTYPMLKEKFNSASAQLIIWISVHFNIGIPNINNWINKTEHDIINNIGAYIGKTISAINGILFALVILPVYLFMLLFYKPLLLEFIHKLFKTEHHIAVCEILIGSKKIIQSYLVGLIVEAVIIATLNSVGLLLLGIDYAIILGITGALLNVIPYIGGVIAIALPMIIAYVTKDSSTYTVLVLLVYLCIQFIDNHFIIPNIVASRVKINALVCILVILMGGALWGVAGMFLSIPLTAILKIIFDHIELLKPWGFMMGNIVPTSKLKLEFVKKRK